MEWWRFPKWSGDYEKGTYEYIEKAFAIKSQGNQIRCPCCTFHYRFWQCSNVLRDHVICNGFVPREEDFLYLGKGNERDEMFEHDEPPSMDDDMQELLNNTIREGPNEEAHKFLKLLEEGQEELYPGCKTFSRLSFIIRLFIYKCDHKLSNVAFTALLELLREVLRDANLPKSFNEANKVIKMLGLDYIKIDACPNDCMLYWENIWKYILQKYMVPEEGRKWAMRMIGRNWRIYKCRTKKKHYYAHQTAEARQNFRTSTISKPQFLQLINYWDDPSVEETSKRNRDNRLLLDDLHTMGPKSYAMLRHELQEADPEHRKPFQAQVYMDSRKRDPKKSYKTEFTKTRDNIAQMEALSAQVGEEGSNWKDPYYDVIKKPEHSGRLRLYGDGVTKTEFKKKGKQAGYIFPQEFVQSIQLNLLEKLQEANPGMTFVIPEGFEGFISSTATHATSECGNSSGGQS